VLRLRLAAIAALVTIGIAGGAVLLTGSASASASSTSLVGKWKGSLESSGYKVRFQVSVNRNQKSGTWRLTSTCGGTLKLKDISDGYHHYYRLGGRGCSAAGVDCLKRAGSGVLDWFDENTGNISYVGTLRRS
jgi:hypothetical protein